VPAAATPYERAWFELGAAARPRGAGGHGGACRSCGGLASAQPQPSGCRFPAIDERRTEPAGSGHFRRCRLRQRHCVAAAAVGAPGGGRHGGTRRIPGGGTRRGGGSPTTHRRVRHGDARRCGGLPACAGGRGALGCRPAAQGGRGRGRRRFAAARADRGTQLAAGRGPPFLFQFSLDPEQEARAVARRIATDGHARGIALFPRNAWGERLQAAFTAEIEAAGVQLTAAQPYDPGTNDYSGPLRAALGRFGRSGDRDASGAPRKRAARLRRSPARSRVHCRDAPGRPRAAPAIALPDGLRVARVRTSDAWDPGPRPVPDLDGLTLPKCPGSERRARRASAVGRAAGRMVRVRSGPVAAVCVRL